MEFLDSITKNLNSSCSLIITQGFKLIDKIAYIDKSIYKIKTIKLFEENSDIINAIIFCIVSGFVIYFVLKTFLSLYKDTYILNLYHYILKVIIITIISFNSIYISRQLVDVNAMFSNLLKSSLEEIGDVKLEFEFLKEDINSIDDILKSINKKGIDSIKDSILSVYVIYVLFVYSCRYVVIILCIILSPFMIILLLDKATSKISFLWFKVFISSLLLEEINMFILFIPITLKKEKDIYTTILIGSLYIMYKLNKKLSEI